MELIAILVVLVGGVSLLAIRRYLRDRRDAEATEASGGTWRIRSELPLDAGPPYADFGAELLLAGPFDVMEGIDGGFEVAYFTTYDRARSSQRVERPGAIVQLQIETPRFRYVAVDLDEDAPEHLQALRQQTPPHHDTSRPGRVGPRAAQLLADARSVIVTTAPFAVWVQSRGASTEAVHRLALALGTAIVADAGATPSHDSRPAGPGALD